MRAWERPLLGDAKGREGSIADLHPTGRPLRVMARSGQSDFDASFAAYRLISGETGHRRLTARCNLDTVPNQLAVMGLAATPQVN